MLALLTLLAAVPIMWIGQSIVRRAAGLPVQRRLSARGLPERWRKANRAVTQVALVAVVVAYPLLLGRTPIDYYGELLPRGAPAFAFAHGLAIAVLFLSLLFFAWNLSGAVEFSMRQSASRTLRRVLTSPVSAVLGAGAEELVFRGVLLRGLMESFPLPAAVAVGAICFALAHYVREVKRYWTLPGHLALGLCLCLAFVWTRALWLPMGVHAGGILAIMAARPFVRYRGPAWVTGASIFPFSGAVGVAALLLLTAVLWSFYGSGVAT